jgi:hypothetical protein
VTVTAPIGALAAAYIAAVEAADAQSLESSVKTAIDNFISGCQSDGIWDAIKSCCILAGARTLDGALVPLKGTAPSKFGFISSDYSRSTGLLGDGTTTKYLNTNRAHNADPQNNFHLAVYHHSNTIPLDNTFYYLIGARSPTTSFSHISLFKGTSGQLGVGAGARTSISQVFTPYGTSSHVAGIYGIARNSASQHIMYYPPTTSSPSSSSYTFNGVTTTTPNATTNYLVFGLAFVTNSPYSPMPGRIAFYSIGEYLDMTLLKARVNTLISALSGL